MADHEWKRFLSIQGQRLGLECLCDCNWGQACREWHVTFALLAEQEREAQKKNGSHQPVDDEVETAKTETQLYGAPCVDLRLSPKALKGEAPENSKQQVWARAITAELVDREQHPDLEDCKLPPHIRIAPHHWTPHQLLYRENGGRISTPQTQEFLRDECNYDAIDTRYYIVDQGTRYIADKGTKKYFNLPNQSKEKVHAVYEIARAQLAESLVAQAAEKKTAASSATSIEKKARKPTTANRAAAASTNKSQSENSAVEALGTVVDASASTNNNIKYSNDEVMKKKAAQKIRINKQSGPVPATATTAATTTTSPTTTEKQQSPSTSNTTLDDTEATLDEETVAQRQRKQIMMAVKQRKHKKQRRNKEKRDASVNSMLENFLESIGTAPSDKAPAAPAAAAGGGGGGGGTTAGTAAAAGTTAGATANAPPAVAETTPADAVVAVAVTATENHTGTAAAAEPRKKAAVTRKRVILAREMTESERLELERAYELQKKESFADFCKKRRRAERQQQEHQREIEALTLQLDREQEAHQATKYKQAEAARLMRNAERRARYRTYRGRKSEPNNNYAV